MDLAHTSRIHWLVELVRLSQPAGADPRQAVQAMLQHLVHGLGGASGCLALRPEGADGLRIVAAIGLPPQALGQHVAAGEGVLGRVLLAGEPVLINGDARADNRFADLPPAPAGKRERSALCWPLVAQSQCIGVVSVNRDAGSAPFDGVDLDAGRPVMALLALAVDHWRTHEDLKSRIERLSAMNTEIQAVNRRLAQTQHQLLQSEKMASIGQLAAGVAHEINNPVGYVASNLATLRGYLQQLFAAIDHPAGDATTGAGEIAFLREDTTALLAECDEGLDRVKQIVQDLKDFSRVDQAHERSDSDLLACLDSTLNIAHNEVKYLATVERALQPLPPVPVIASQINQVLLNLLVNAAHAIRQAGRGGAEGRIVLRSGHDDDQAWIEVEDNGCGIAPQHLGRIFEPFFTTKPVGQGTGLGLSLSYAIARDHQGRLEVRSEQGIGSCFRLVLPRRAPAPASA
ncbi:MAG: ATP-binding protein [Burkholderiaceae bacterium]